MKWFAVVGLASVATVCSGCGRETQAPPSSSAAARDIPRPPDPERGAGTGPATGRAAFVSVREGRFIDPEGRQLLLHGMSVISKSKEQHYQSWHGPEEFADMHDWGMNCIRLGILWDGIEPEPGMYDETYLKKVDERVRWAKEHGLYVLLDMHQDLFSVLYSDGAPEWATLSGGKPHTAAGSVWSDAYFTSPAVQTAFDNFWANTSGPGGVGIQDRFASAWQHVAARYAHEPAVIGYDLFNEPNCGSANTQAQLLVIARLAEMIAKKDGSAAPTVFELGGQWLTPDGRSKLLGRLRDMDVYVPVIDAAESLFKEFERTGLMPMFDRVVRAIREVDANHIIFLETSMSANMGIYSGIEPVRGPGGERDPLQAYAPHGYDIVVDTPDVANASNERVELIFRRHGETARRLDMPMIVGEWGAYGQAGAAVWPSAQFAVCQFEKLLCGDVYWEFGQYVRGAAYFDALCRPIPAAVAGTLLAYGYEPDANTFTCTWREDGTPLAPTRIYIPARVFAPPNAVRVSPNGEGFEVEPAAAGSQNVYIVVPPLGGAAERSLSVAHPS